MHKTSIILSYMNTLVNSKTYNSVDQTNLIATKKRDFRSINWLKNLLWVL